MPARKYILFSFLMIVFGAGIKAQDVLMTQTINGRVYRMGTDTAIAGASVYYGGSMSGTATDGTGYFALKAKAQQIPIVVSCIGYISATVHYEEGKPLVVYLVPKTEMLNMVTIIAGNDSGYGGDGMSRKDREALFISEFIGTSAFAKNCTITNMDDIRLFYNRKKDALTAICDKPIMIENRSLGYTIKYYLDRFSKTPGKLAFAGNYIFNDPQNPPDDSVKLNRSNAYKGSRIQFIRSLWNHTLKQDGYRMYTPSFAQITEDDITTHDIEQQKHMVLTQSIFVVNSHVPLVINTVNTGNSSLPFIDKDGYYGEGLQWTGGMGSQRIGDLLPYEYQPEKEFKKTAPPNK